MVPSEQLHFEQGMWRVTVNGKLYCAQTKELLKRGLSSIGIAVIEPVEPFIDERTRAEVLIDVLHDNKYKLQEKQAALKELYHMANEGNPLAEELVKQVPSERSKYAQYYTKQIGKTDFLFVSYEELTEYVDNIVLRSRLLSELGKLYEKI